MKKILALGAVLAAVLIVIAADPPRGGRVDNRVLAGVTVNVQDQSYRDGLPVFIITGSPAPFIVTNTWEGQYFVNTNTTIGLPNPTNNLARKFMFAAMGTNTFFVSNGAGGQLTIVSSNVVGILVGINSNRQAYAWSTGTNWAVVP